MTDMLERQLRALAQRLDLDPDASLVVDVLDRLDAPPAALESARPRRRALAIGSMVIAAAIMLVLILPAPRRTVAHWFGIGIVRIDGPPVQTTIVPTTATPTTAVPTTPRSTTTIPESSITVSTPEPPTEPTTEPPTEPPASFPAEMDLGRPTTAADASLRTGLPASVAPSLGTPQGIYVVSPPASGQIVVVYPPSATLPATRVAGTGALLSIMPGTIEDGLFAKGLSPGTSVETLSFLDAAGVSVNAAWLSGQPHTYAFVDRNGQVHFDTLRLATTTLLWSDGQITYRLEADVSRDAAIGIARSVVPG